jgi:hypothetical protein
VNFFEQYGQEVLTLDLNVNGQPMRVEFLRELVLNTDDLIDYKQLITRMSQLPGMISFYGVLKDRATREMKEAEEEFDIWYAEKSEFINEKKINETATRNIAASLKKAPTIAQIKGFVMVEHKEDWEKKKSNLRSLKERESVLSRVLQGLEAATNLVQSQNKLLILLWEKGIEEVRARLPVRT